MNFNIWIQKNFRFQKEVAAKLSMTPVRLSRLVNGNAYPSPDEKAAIWELTGGKVSEKDFKHPAT